MIVRPGYWARTELLPSDWGFITPTIILLRQRPPPFFFQVCLTGYDFCNFLLSFVIFLSPYHSHENRAPLNKYKHLRLGKPLA